MMKKLFLAMVAAAVLLTPMAAGARDWGFIPTLQAAQGDMKKGSGQSRRGGGDQRREKEAPPPPRDERHGRMTDEQRRDLHRDLDRANREIYRQKGGR